MAILNTQATNKTRVVVNLPDTASGYLLATLISRVAISGADEVFQGGERVSKGQTYRCTLDANGDPDSTAHPSGWFLPTPDTSGAAGWRFTFEAVDSDGNRQYLYTATVAYSASPQQLADILAAGIADSDPDATAVLLTGYLPLAGGTMTGQLNFDGTTHAGLKLLSLTEAERDALTAVNGMLIYNETEGKVQSYQSGAWVSIGVASAPALDDVSDVTLTAVADNEVLAYDNGSSNWINQTAAEAGLATSGHDHDADYEAAGAVAAHEADTTNIHGIADTSNLLDTADIGNSVAAQAHNHDYVPEDAAILSKTEAYELAAGDEAKVIECDGTFTITCPDGLDAGFQVAIVNIGSGTITIAAETTLQSKDSAATIATQYAMAVVYHRGSNVWLLAGDIE